MTVPLIRPDQFTAPHPRRAKKQRLRIDPIQALDFVRDPMRISMFVLTILTISRVHQHYGFLAKLRPALLLVLASAGYAYLHPVFLTKAKIFKLWPMKALVMLSILSVTSAAFGISLGRSASFILNNYSKTLLYAFLVALTIRHVRDLYTYVWAYSISCGILAFFSLFVFGLHQSSNSYVTRLSDLYTYDSNDLGVIMMIGLPLSLLLLLTARGWKRWVVVATLIAICATVARSGSRGAFLGFLAVGAGALFIVNSVTISRRITLLVVAALALWWGAPPGYWKQMKTIFNPQEDYNYSARDGRKELFKRGIVYVKRYPVFGLGIDNFARAECTISPKIEDLGRARLRCTPPHNSYVQAGTEMGVPGLIVWGGLVFGGIVAPLRLRRRLPRWWRRGTEVQRFLYGATTFMPLAMVGFAVTAGFVSFAWMDPICLMAAFLTGLYVSLREYIRAAGPAAGGPIVLTGRKLRPRGWRVMRSAQRWMSAQTGVRQ